MSKVRTNRRLSTANLANVLLLVKYRDGDAYVRSVWLCSRNDVIGNLTVVLAASGVWRTGSAWSDLIVAEIMASRFLWSAIQIIKQDMAESHSCRDDGTVDPKAARSSWA